MTLWTHAESVTVCMLVLTDRVQGLGGGEESDSSQRSVGSVGLPRQLLSNDSRTHHLHTDHETNLSRDRQQQLHRRLPGHVK